MPQFLKRLFFIAALVIVANVIGTLGFVFIEHWSLFDSFYMTLMTLTTVGYGEVHPLSYHGRVFASFLMLVGVTTVFVSIAILGETLLRLEMTDYFDRKRRDRMLKDISGHYIVCGAGRVGRSVIQELLRSEATVVLIDNSVERARWATDKGVITMVGDATKDEVLRQARVETAKGLVAAIASDAENVYVALSAKVLNPQVGHCRSSQRRTGRRKTAAGGRHHGLHALFVYRTPTGAILVAASRLELSGCRFGLSSVLGLGSGDRTITNRRGQLHGFQDARAVAARQSIWSDRAGGSPKKRRPCNSILLPTFASSLAMCLSPWANGRN